MPRSLALFSLRFLQTLKNFSSIFVVVLILKVTFRIWRTINKFFRQEFRIQIFQRNLLGFVQRISSDLSLQSYWPSHTRLLSIHSPLEQVASVGPHVLRGKTVGTSPVKKCKIRRSFSVLMMRLATSHYTTDNPLLSIVTNWIIAIALAIRIFTFLHSSIV